MTVRRHIRIHAAHNRTGPATLPTPPAWMVEGLCAQTDPEEFFPEKGGSTRLAKRVCLRCPVIAECRDYAVSNHERHGIWGGLSERDRRRLTNPGSAVTGDEAAEVCRLYAAGESIDRVAMFTGLSQWRIRNCLVENGVAIRTRGGKPAAS